MGNVNELDCLRVLCDLVASRSCTLVMLQHYEIIPGQRQVLLLVGTDMGTSEVYLTKPVITDTADAVYVYLR